jgi:hypothetical protein
VADVYTNLVASTGKNITGLNILDVTGINPYLVTMGAGSGVQFDIGDALWDENATPRKYLVIDISGDVLTVKDSEASGVPDFSGSSQAACTRYYTGATALNDWLIDLVINNGIYLSGDKAIAHCVNDDDVAFDESISVNISSFFGYHITVPQGHRHIGIAGTGTRFIGGSAPQFYFIEFRTSAGLQRVSWLSFNFNDNQDKWQAVSVESSDAAQYNAVIDHNIMYGTDSVLNARFQIIRMAAVRPMSVYNNIIYNFKSYQTTGTVISGIWTNDDKVIANNNTVYGIERTVSGTVAGIFMLVNSANIDIKNNICMNNVSAGSGGDFIFPGTTADSETNLSSDDTADDGGGTGHLIDKLAVDQFISIDPGFENFQLKSGADAIDAGTNIGTVPEDVNIDMLGRDRFAEGDTWDIGTHEFVQAPVPPTGLLFLPVKKYRRDALAGTRLDPTKSTGLIGLWDFNYGDDINVFDQSPFGNHGKWFGSSSNRYAPGPPSLGGRAGKFNGSDDWAVIPSVLGSSVASFSVCMWLYMTSNDNIAGAWDGWAAKKQWMFRQAVNTQQFSVEKAAGGSATVGGIGAYIYNRWFFLAGVADGSNIKSSIDGAGFNSAALVGPYLPSGESNYRLGSPRGSASLLGNMAHALIFNKALTISEIRDIYLNGRDLYQKDISTFNFIDTGVPPAISPTPWHLFIT